MEEDGLWLMSSELLGRLVVCSLASSHWSPPQRQQPRNLPKGGAVSVVGSLRSRLPEPRYQMPEAKRTTMSIEEALTWRDESFVTREELFDDV